MASKESNSAEMSNARTDYQNIDYSDTTRGKHFVKFN